MRVSRCIPSAGPGHWRYYFTPPGLLIPDELPEHWGLLEMLPKIVKVIKKAEFIREERISWEDSRLLYRVARILIIARDTGNERIAMDITGKKPPTL